MYQLAVYYRNFSSRIYCTNAPQKIHFEQLNSNSDLKLNLSNIYELLLSAEQISV